MTKSFNNIKKDVISLLEERLPSYLSYHSIPHTLYVINTAIHIGEKEGISIADMELLKIAALFHDVGFINISDGHELESCKIAQQLLPKYGYLDKEIADVCEAIMATKIPQKPTTHIGQILADADLEYLATNQFNSISELLYKELKHFNKKLTRRQWNKIQINFISEHNYHTKFCKHYKSFRKLKLLKQLKKNS